MKKYTFWFSAAAWTQLLTGLLHSLSFFNDPKGSNEKEETLIELMNGLQIDMGAGFIRTMSDLMNALSIGYMLLFLFAGALNLFMMKKQADSVLLKGIILIQLAVFGSSFMAMLVFAFLPPLVLNGLVVLSLAASYLLMTGKGATG